jgi:beta-glucosidase
MTKLGYFTLLLAIPFAVVSCSSPSTTSQKANDGIAKEIGLRKSSEAIEAQVDYLLGQLTLEEKISLVHANSKFTVAGVERLGIPEMRLSDGPHGVRAEVMRHQWDSANWETDYATYLPPLTAVAASWDPAIATMHGNVLGSEARHREKDIILGPGVNLARLPTYGRNFEYLGEDPFLASRMVVPEIKAIQEHDVAACVKHYALNSQELNRFSVNAEPDERALREVYLPAFEAAVKEAKVWSVMGAYNQVYGTNANQSRLLVNDILKQQWGFNGVVLTDWHVDINTFDAAMNGLDLEMGTDVPNYEDYFFAQPLLKMIKDGKVPEAILDEKVRRILRMQIHIGMMDPARKAGARNTPEHRQAAQTIAENGIVLLKNSRQALPLNKSTLKKLVVMGPNASLRHGRGGGSSQVKSDYEVTPLQGLQKALGKDVEIIYLRAATNADVEPIAADYLTTRHRSGTPTWNASYYESAARTGTPVIDRIPSSSFTAADKNKTQYLTLTAVLTPLASGVHKLRLQVVGSASVNVDGKEVMNVKNGVGKVAEQDITLEGGKPYSFEVRYDGSQTFTLGWEEPGSHYNTKAEYMATARSADAVLYFGGLNHDYDREGQDRANMQLPGGQDQVIADLAKANPNTVVFLVAGSAVEMPWADQVSTIVWGWYGGMESGHAFARMLLGDVNPSGKMPITLPAKLTDTAPIKLDDYNDKISLYKEGVFIGYRWFEQQNIQPTFVFGHGLSYTTFAISNLQMPARFAKDAKEFPVKVSVKNTGKRAGAEVVQLYLGDMEASVPRPAKELKGFNKVFLEPGESKTLTITLTPRDLSFWDVKSQDWLAEEGQFKVMIGSSVANIQAQGQFEYR